VQTVVRASRTPTIEFNATRCAICGTLGNAREVYRANLNVGAFRPDVFSARRLPDRLHYRVVRCNGCGLVRSDPVADGAMIDDLYARGTVTYGDEVPGLRATYGRYLERAAPHGSTRGTLLEIGCGDGFFLEEALRHGYRRALGVEPAEAAIAQARPDIRPNIRRDVMRPDLFPAGSIDLVCLFQVFDHLPDPGAVLDECRRILRPGGVVLCLNHDVDAASARILGEGSPIVDVEHTYLYGRRTLRLIFERHGYRVCESGPVVNSCSLYYLLRLLPLPRRLKSVALAALSRTPIGRWRVPVRLGNQYLVARIPCTVDRDGAESGRGPNV